MSTTEQELLTKWRELSQEKKQTVLEFVNFLHIKVAEDQALARENKVKLGESLRQIRADIVASGEPLLNEVEIEQEIANRRGGLQDN
jgi:hypothetical protein